MAGRPLVPVTLAALEAQGLLSSWCLDRSVVERLLEAIEEEYVFNNGYHNNIHAADVVQSVNCMIMGDTTGFTKVERFAILLAAAGHDLAHPGVTNDFHIATRSPLAELFNDQSCNEHYHVRGLLRILDRFGGPLKASFATDEWRYVRNVITATILATDMKMHFSVLEAFEKGLREKDVSPLPRLKMCLHLADISNPARRIEIAEQWAYGLRNELVSQGERGTRRAIADVRAEGGRPGTRPDGFRRTCPTCPVPRRTCPTCSPPVSPCAAEAREGIPMTPMCDPSLAIPPGQVMFIEMYLLQTIELWASTAPVMGGVLRSGAQETLATWKGRAAGV